MSTEQNKALVRRFTELFNAGKLDDIEKELVDSKAVIHFAGMPAPLNRDGFKQLGFAFRAAFPDIQVMAEDEVAEGDRVVTRGYFTGTHQGDFQGIPPTGKQVNVTYIDLWRVENGKLMEYWIEQDQLGMMQQLGVIPASAQ